MLIAISVLGALVALLGAGLLWIGKQLRPDETSLTEQINAVLPQTQCAQCGDPGCRPYAQAIAEGQADINQCPPGGEDGVRALATLPPISEPSY